MKFKQNGITAFFILLLITLGLFVDVLFLSDKDVLSREGTDVYNQFIYWRDFGFRQMKQGNLPLWNPHIFSGVPYFGGFQSALLYPPNFLYLILPLGRAINISIALHVFLIGFFMYLWTSHRKLHFLACLLASVLVMCSSAHFLHIFAGHLPNLCVMTWVPLLFLSIDGLCERPSLGWFLLGTFVVAMQVLAGHPQYLYYTAISASIYAGLCLIRSAKRLVSVLSILGIYFFGFSLSAVQVFGGLQASAESVRSVRLPFAFASSFSFPPENFLTLVSPFFFGDMDRIPYWGRWYLWEMCLFVSISGLVLAVLGAIYGKKDIRRYSILMFFLLILLALGVHTPLYAILYHLLPGFNKFRGSSKFVFQASLFLIMLAGIGLDDLIRSSRIKKKQFLAYMMFPLLFFALSVLSFISANSSGSGVWKSVFHFFADTQDSYLKPYLYSDPSFIHQAAVFASRNLLVASIILFLLGFLLVLRNKYPEAVYLISALAFIEIVLFVRQARPTFDIRRAMNQELSQFFAQNPGDYRVSNLLNPNRAVSTGAKDIWGLDPGALLRYAQFMTCLQGKDPDQVTQDVSSKKYHPLFSMLRCRYIITRDKEKLLIQETPSPLPHLQLLKDWRVVKDRDGIFQEMQKEGFDPSQTVILEKTPDPRPGRSEEKGTCAVVEASTDHLLIKAYLPEAAILLIADSYSKGWRAREVKPDSQRRYKILPANYILMAISLSAGNHLLRLEYLPSAFRPGMGISVFALAVYLSLLGVFFLRFRPRRGVRAEEALVGLSGHGSLTEGKGERSPEASGLARRDKPRPTKCIARAYPRDPFPHQIDFHLTF